MLSDLFLLFHLCAASSKQMLDGWKQRPTLAAFFRLPFPDVRSLLDVPGDELLLAVNVVGYHALAPLLSFLPLCPLRLPALLAL